MEISPSHFNLTAFRSINSLFDKNNTGLELKELDELEKSHLLKLTEAYILNKNFGLDYSSNETLLADIKQSTTSIFSDAVEGLAIIVKQNKISNLLELDRWMEKEEERCLGFLQSSVCSPL